MDGKMLYKIHKGSNGFYEIMAGSVEIDLISHKELESTGMFGYFTNSYSFYPKFKNALKIAVEYKAEELIQSYLGLVNIN